MRQRGSGDPLDVTPEPLLLALAIAAQTADDGSLLTQLLGANLGAVFVVLMCTRRLRAAQRGDERLERHALWRFVPLYYLSGWLLVAGFAIALVRQDSASVREIAAFATLVALWLVAGLLLWRDRRIELAPHAS